MHAMKMSDTQHAGKSPGSTVLNPAESQLLQSSLLAMAQAQGDAGQNGPPALSSTPTLGGLLQALRRRWALAGGLAVAAALIMGIAVFTFMPPKYLATTRFRVAAKQLGAEDIEFPIFKANMEALVKSPLVLNAALNDKTPAGKEVKDLDIVRAKGMGAIEWLEKSIKTDYLLGPEVLRVSLAADNPEEAADLLNAIARAFLNEYAEMERSKKQQRLAELRVKKDRIEEELRRLRTRLDHQIKELEAKDRDFVNNQQQMLMHKLASTDTRRAANEDAIVKAEGEIVTYKARLKSLDKTPIPDKVLFELFGKDPLLQSYNKRIGELQDEINRVYSTYFEPTASQKAIPLKHEKLIVLRQKEAEEARLKPAIEERWRANMREELKEAIVITEEKIAEMGLHRERLAKEMVDLNTRIKNGLPGEAPALLATKEKIELEKLALNFTAQKISEIETEPLAMRVYLGPPAQAPTAKDRSQQTKIAGAGGLGVFMMALFGVAFLEFRSRKINQPEEVAKGLGLNVLGTIPAMPARSKKPDAVAEQKWQNQLQESVDAIRTVLLHQARTEALHVLMITSAQSGEGKTTLATQLAASLARAWKRVLVIDADLRHPAAHKLFDTPQEPGLAEVMRGEVEATDAVRATSLSRLWLLPAGNGDTHAIQALAQDNVRTLFEQLKQQYDFVIIDTPPLLAVTDSLLLAQHVDGVLYAILRDVSRAPAIYAAQQKLAPLGVRTLGAVVIGADAEFNDKTYGYAVK
jgi:polysaccharide biosynthesis transport protein